MGVFKRFDEWHVDNGNGAANILHDVATETARFICDVRETYPRSFFDRGFGHGVANYVCNAFDKPPLNPPVPPFQGGQCEDLTYKVECLWQGDPRVQTQVEGKVESVECSISGDRFYRVIVNRGLPNEVVGNNSNQLHQGAQSDGVEISVVGDGVDNCGNPPTQFPPDPPRDPVDFSRQVVINNYNNDGDIIDSQDILVVLDDKDVYNFPIVVNFGGIDISLNLDGFGVPDVEPSPEDIGGEGGGGLPVVQVEPPLLAEELEEEEKEEVEEEEEEDETIEMVAVVIVKEPVHGKTILQLQERNNNYFAGYFVWMVDTPAGRHDLPHIPIRNRRCIFRSPGQTAGYRLYSVNGATLRATTYKLPVTEE